MSSLLGEKCGSRFPSGQKASTSPQRSCVMRCRTELPWIAWTGPPTASPKCYAKDQARDTLRIGRDWPVKLTICTDQNEWRTNGSYTVSRASGCAHSRTKSLNSGDGRTSWSPHSVGSPKATPRHPIEDSDCRFCVRRRGNEKSHGKKPSALQPRHDQASPGRRLSETILSLAVARASFRQCAMKISRSPRTVESLLRKLLLP